MSKASIAIALCISLPLMARADYAAGNFGLLKSCMRVSEYVQLLAAYGAKGQTLEASRKIPTLAYEYGVDVDLLIVAAGDNARGVIGGVPNKLRSFIRDSEECVWSGCKSVNNFSNGVNIAGELKTACILDYRGD